MITEDYVSFKTAKLLKEKGFNWGCKRMFRALKSSTPKVYDYSEWVTNQDLCDLYQNCEFAVIPTLQMAMKWLQETFNIVIIPNYEYECNDTPWCYKIFKLGENGKPERAAVKGVSYDKDNNPTEHIVSYRDYERSYKDYSTKEEAIEEGIKYCLENLI